MDILSTSPLQGSGNYYIQQETFGYDLWFTDINPSLYYCIAKFDYTASAWTITAEGKLIGHYNGTDYDYRLSTERFVTIEQEKDFSQLQTWDNGVLYKRVKTNLCNIKLYFDTESVVTANSGNITVDAGGTMHQNSEFTGYLQMYDMTFYDKLTSLKNVFPITPRVYSENWLAVGCYSTSEEETTEIEYYNADHDLVYQYSLFGTDEGNLRQFWLWIPAEVYTVVMYRTSDGSRMNYDVRPNCKATPVYFWNDGVIDTLFCEGSKKEVQNVSRKTVKVGDKTYPIGVQVENSYLINTGFNLSQDQVFGLIKSPLCFIPLKDKYTSTLLSLGAYLIGNQTFDSWTGKNFSERNIELSLTSNLARRTKSGVKLNFFD